MPSFPRRRSTSKLFPPSALVVALGLLGVPATSMAQVYFNDAGASGPVEPTSFAPASPSYLTGYVRDLSWQSWGGATATATGIVESSPNGTSPATVTLSGLGSCGGQPVYASYEIQVAAGVVPGLDWAKARRGTFACQFSAGNYRPSKQDASGGCTFLNPNRAWSPHVPNGWAYTGFCRMQWTGFATGPVAVGKGVLRTGLEQWGVEARFSGLAWCREGMGDAIAYTRLSMTTYGAGESEDNGDITVGIANRLRANIGRSGLSKRTYRSTKAITKGCVALEE